ncbi:MAG: flagella basal body P-ring formation protein FlgA [Novosphingobium sp.]
MTRTTLILLAAAALPAPALAAPTVDLAQIDSQVAQFTGAPQGAVGGAVLPVDRRLRLAACNSPLTIGWHTARRESVVVQCPDAGSWRLFVPVTPARQAGAAPEAPAVTPNEAVTVSVTGEGFAVSQPGIALDKGAVGSWVRVKMVSAGQPKGDAMRAQVIRPGLVAIPMD